MTRHGVLAGVLGVFLVLGATPVPAQNAPPAAGAQAVPQREFIYGAELMTPAERERYRERVRAAGDADKVRTDHQRQLRERARQRGVQLSEPAGTVQRGGGAR